MSTICRRYFIIFLAVKLQRVAGTLVIPLSMFIYIYKTGEAVKFRTCAATGSAPFEQDEGDLREVSKGKSNPLPIHYVLRT